MSTTNMEAITEEREAIASRPKNFDRFGPRWFCDPDFYPIARANEVDLALQRFPQLRADQKTFATILAHLGLAEGPDFTDQQKLTIYRAWKQLNATILDPIGNATYRFDYLAMPAAAGSPEGLRSAGTIWAKGATACASCASARRRPRDANSRRR